MTTDRRGPALRPMTQTVSLPELETAHPTGRIHACDFHVTGAESGEPVPGGLRLGRVLNVDHHAPVAHMERFVSSTTLALELIEQAGQPSVGDVVVINHTDCDSVLAGALLTGLLPPDPRLNDAAVAADHSGASDPLADALQAIDELRDFPLSLETARAVLAGRPLPAPVLPYVRGRQRSRERAAELAADSTAEGGVALIVSDAPTDGEFFPALLPEAAIIVISSPSADRPIIKLRLGLAAPAGLSLQRLGVNQFDPAYGGRWNAGSNRRGGGCGMDPGAYADEVRQRYRSAVTGFRDT